MRLLLDMDFPLVWFADTSIVERSPLDGKVHVIR
jgi:hypothetical protein